MRSRKSGEIASLQPVPGVAGGFAFAKLASVMCGGIQLVFVLKALSAF